MLEAALLLYLCALTAYAVWKTRDAHHFTREGEQEQGGRMVGIWVCRRCTPVHYERHQEF